MLPGLLAAFSGMAPLEGQVYALLQTTSLLAHNFRLDQRLPFFYAL